ncbi:hypothetical protein BDZ91DRAFT_733489 [Kalaharituber pfeilii]|nr:hypothetical protein BDZ91DRAFT_733489 [Kalaharituber pfeilii]
MDGLSAYSRDSYTQARFGTPNYGIYMHILSTQYSPVCAINYWPTSAWLYTSFWYPVNWHHSMAPSTLNCLPPVITVNLFSHSFTGRNSPTFPSLSILDIILPASFFPFPLSCPIILLLPNSCSQSCCLVLASIPLVRLSVANSTLYLFGAVSPVLL